MHLIHRGILNRKFKENTLKSFEASFEKGYGIETDIHATKDNKFICFHDFTLKRIHGKNRSIKALNYNQIKNITRNEIPLLTDLLKISKNKYSIFLEIKPLLSIKQIKKLLIETKKYKRCVFISFKEENIYKILNINKSIKVGLSFTQYGNIKNIKKKLKNKNINFLILDKYFLKNKKIKKMKIKKLFYTIKKKSEFKKYFRNNNLIFENL
tara:strand:+ start:801 stop:1433 length:633 start_codon:yes stop_codon:yes gene_type:complete